MGLIEMTKDATLGFYNGTGLLKVPVKQYDNARKIRIMLIDDTGEEYKIPDDIDINFKALKPDKTQINTSEVLEVTDNRIIVSITDQMTVVSGIVHCEIILHKNGKRITTTKFDLIVEDSVHDDSHIDESTDYNDLLDTIEEAKLVIENCKDTVNDFKDKLDNNYFVLTEEKDAVNGIPVLDENAKIPIKELYEGSTSDKGIIKLTDSVNSNSTTTAATPNSVKKVNDSLSVEVSRAKKEEQDINSDLNSHISNTSNPHTVTKYQVGLGNVDNTSDINKPVSTAQQSAIDLAYENSNKYTDTKISKLINGAPSTLDTLGEIADAMNNNKDVVDALNVAVGEKANQTELDSHVKNNNIHITSQERTNWDSAKSHADSTHARTDATKVEKSSTNGNIKINGTETTVYTHPSGTNPHGTTKSDVGLSNVPNVSTNDQAPTYTESTTLAKISSGEKISIAFGKISKAISDLISHIANKNNPHAVTKTQIGLENVENKSSDTIRSEMTKKNVTDALGYEPATSASSVSGVKGNAELSYRTGNVNLTPENIGAPEKNEVYLLAGGINIPEGSDLKSDTYKMIGNYNCRSNDVVKTLINCPFTSAFILKVDYPTGGTGQGYVRQTFIKYSDSKTVTRIWDPYTNSGQWTSEQEFILRKDLTAQNTTATDTHALLGAEGANSTVQTLIDEIADRVIDKLLPRDGSKEMTGMLTLRNGGNGINANTSQIVNLGNLRMFTNGSIVFQTGRSSEIENGKIANGYFSANYDSEADRMYPSWGTRKKENNYYQSKEILTTESVINDFTSTATDKPASANAVRELNEKLNKIYPIGTIYMSINSTNPGGLFGGTWVRWGSGKFIVGVDENDTYFNTVKEGGTKTLNLSHNHTVEYHTHSTADHILGIEEIPSHSHNFKLGGSAFAINTSYSANDSMYTQGLGTSSGGWWNRTNKNTTEINATGGGGAHNHGSTGGASPKTDSGLSDVNIMPPYITCYMWLRTA